MTDFIYSDGIHFCQAVTCGVLLSVAYDFIRIFRRVIKHKRVFSVALEDIVFWMFAGFAVFALMYETTSGVIRGFVVAGCVLGAVLYKNTFSNFIVEHLSGLVKFVMKILIFPLKKCWISFKIGFEGVVRFFKKHIRGKGNDRRKKSIGKQKEYSASRKKTKTF